MGTEAVLTGAPAAIASITAPASGTDVDLQLLSGTLLTSAQTNSVTCLKGFLDADRLRQGASTTQPA